EPELWHLKSEGATVSVLSDWFEAAYKYVGEESRAVWSLWLSAVLPEEDAGREVRHLRDHVLQNYSTNRVHSLARKHFPNEPDVNPKQLTPEARLSYAAALYRFGETVQSRDIVTELYRTEKNERLRTEAATLAEKIFRARGETENRVKWQMIL